MMIGVLLILIKIWLKYFWSIKPELALEPTINSDTADFSANLELLDENVRKTGDLITLNYEEVSFINQPLAKVNNVNPFHIHFLVKLN